MARGSLVERNVRDAFELCRRGPQAGKLAAALRGRRARRDGRGAAEP